MKEIGYKFIKNPNAGFYSERRPCYIPDLEENIENLDKKYRSYCMICGWDVVCVEWPTVIDLETGDYYYHVSECEMEDLSE